MSNKKQYFELITLNIKKCGYHLYIVNDSGALPRFGYTIGLSKTIGYELVLAGALLYSNEDVQKIIDEVSRMCIKENSIDTVNTSLGQFSMKNVDETWIEELMLGALDYYDVDTVPTIQLVPTGEYMTIDVPDLSKMFNADKESIWKYLIKEWDYPFTESSTCVTDLDTLRGKALIQAIRWEEDYWEAFSKPPSEIAEEESRFVPLGFILGINESYDKIATLSVNQGISYSNGDESWEIWDVDS